MEAALGEAPSAEQAGPGPEPRTALLTFYPRYAWVAPGSYSPLNSAVLPSDLFMEAVQLLRLISRDVSPLSLHRMPGNSTLVPDEKRALHAGLVPERFFEGAAEARVALRSITVRGRRET